MAGGTTEPKSANNGPEKPSLPEDNPRELLNSANSAAAQARASWFAFLGLVAYMIVAVGSVSHIDLLLDRRLRLPFVNVEIPLTGFFVLAPFILVLVHLALLVQHTMLAHKYHFFTKAIAASERGAQRSHPDRRLVNSYVFAQLLAGPQPSIVLELLMRAMVWITISFLPIATLLFFQVTFLPYHDVVVTNLQRLALILDVLLLIVLPPLFCFPSLLNREANANECNTTPGRRPWLPRMSSAGFECGPVDWPWRMRYRHVGAALAVTLIVFSFSFLLATVPDSRLDQLTSSRFNRDTAATGNVTAASFALAQSSEPTGPAPQEGDRRRFDEWLVSELCLDPPGSEAADYRSFLHCLKQSLFDGAPDPVFSRPGSIFGRRIIFTDANARLAGLESETFLSLRGRDLSYSHLEKAPLKAADFTGADFTGASLRFVELDGVTISKCFDSDDPLCPNFETANLSEAKLRGSDLIGGRLKRVELARADLTGADLSFADLREANLDSAQLSGALLTEANLADASLKGATLNRANFFGATLERADLEYADLKCADLTGANLRGANLQNADLTGAILDGADLAETIFGDLTDLQVAGSTPQCDEPDGRD